MQSHIDNTTHREIQLGSKLIDFQKYFVELGEDVYHRKEIGGRTRRLAQHYLTFNPETDEIKVTRLVTQPFIQGKTNKLTGHIARPIESSLAECDFRSYIKASFKHVLEIANDTPDTESKWLVNCHQVRTHSSPTQHGIPVPEGVHKDGADYVVMGCVDKQSVSGGISTIHESEDGPAMFETTLEPGNALLIKDREIYHMVSPIESIEKGATGYRDMILMGFHKWERNHYRFDWHEHIYSEKTREH